MKSQLINYLDGRYQVRLSELKITLEEMVATQLGTLGIAGVDIEFLRKILTMFNTFNDNTSLHVQAFRRTQVPSKNVMFKW